MIIRLRHTSCAARNVDLTNVDLTKWKCLGEVRDAFGLLVENEASHVSHVQTSCGNFHLRMNKLDEPLLSVLQPGSEM